MEHDGKRKTPAEYTVNDTVACSTGEMVDTRQRKALKEDGGEQ